MTEGNVDHAFRVEARVQKHRVTAGSTHPKTDALIEQLRGKHVDIVEENLRADVFVDCSYTVVYSK